MSEELTKTIQNTIKAVSEVDKAIKDDGKPTPKILIGVPILAWTHEFALSFLSFWTGLMLYQHKGRDFQVGFEFKYRRPVHLAEEELAQLAIDLNCSHLLLMDDDIYGAAPEDLLKLLDADKDIIGGIMHAGGFPYAMCAFRRFDPTKAVAEQPLLKDSTRLYEIPSDQRQGIQPVDLIPFAFTLIKTDVFKKLAKPWFKCDTNAPTDSWFADSVLNASFGYFAHFGVWLNHRGVTVNNVGIYQQLGLLEARLNQQARVVEMTPEEMFKHEQMVQQKMRAAEEQYAKAQAAKVKFFTKSSGEFSEVTTNVGGENAVEQCIKEQV